MHGMVVVVVVVVVVVNAAAWMRWAGPLTAKGALMRHRRLVFSLARSYRFFRPRPRP